MLTGCLDELTFIFARPFFWILFKWFGRFSLSSLPWSFDESTARSACVFDSCVSGSEGRHFWAAQNCFWWRKWPHGHREEEGHVHERLQDAGLHRESAGSVKKNASCVCASRPWCFPCRTTWTRPWTSPRLLRGCWPWTTCCTWPRFTRTPTSGSVFWLFSS